MSARRQRGHCNASAASAGRAGLPSALCTSASKAASAYGRSGGKVMSMAPDPLIEEGDTLVLSGKAEMLALAEQKLLKG